MFLDLAKAFDKVPHKRLLGKLKKHGISGSILNVIEDWLKDGGSECVLKGDGLDGSEFGAEYRRGQC